MHMYVSAGRADEDGQLSDASGVGWPAADRQRPGPLESLETLVASVASLLEATVRIQEETAAVLRDLAAHTSGEAAARRLTGAGGPGRWLAPAPDGWSAQDGRAGKQPPQPSSRADPGSLAEPLTAQERAVLRRLTSTLSLREIGQELHVSLNTIKSHTRAIYRKLSVSSRQQAVQCARDLGLLPFLALRRGDVPTVAHAVADSGTFGPMAGQHRR